MCFILRHELELLRPAPDKDKDDPSPQGHWSAYRKEKANRPEKHLLKGWGTAKWIRRGDSVRLRTVLPQHSGEGRVFWWEREKRHSDRDWGLPATKVERVSADTAELKRGSFICPCSQGPFEKDRLEIALKETWVLRESVCAESDCETRQKETKERHVRRTIDRK